MPRPKRIEYENAFYHVMNRGRARQTIFPDRRYYQAFLETLGEAHERFHCVIHAYCLMGNHYHLLLETPLANLSRIMRHINGVYTQRHNRLKRTDGTLFRGRYKSILVDKNGYLLSLTRYIHRNPIDMKQPMVKKLSEYPWSSYAAYVNQAKSPDWLHREMSYKALGLKQRYSGYEKYVEQGVDEETAKYYQRGNTVRIVGDKEFKAWVYDDLLPELEAEEKCRFIDPTKSMKTIVQAVSEVYKVEITNITNVVKGPQKGNEARKIAMYLSQELADVKLQEIADYFGLGHVGSVSFITHQVRKKKKQDRKYSQKIDALIRSIVKKATCP